VLGRLELGELLLRIEPACDGEVADRLEGIVPDDLWPLPKYAEIPFIK